jgi:hypothetical protein
MIKAMELQDKEEHEEREETMEDKTDTFTKSFQIFTTAYTYDKTTTRQIS